MIRVRDDKLPLPPTAEPGRPTIELDEPVDDLPAKSLDAEDERLQRLAAKKQQRSRIAVLLMDLAGETSEQRIEGHKRGLSMDSSTGSHAKRVHIRAKGPTTYEEKSLREYREYAATCKTYFTVKSSRNRAGGYIFKRKRS